MAKKNPHRRKKQSPKTAVSVQVFDKPAPEAEVALEEYRQEKNWLRVFLIFALITLVAGLLFWVVKIAQNETVTQTNTTGSSSNSSQGIPLPSGGNLGQLGQQNTSGVQSSNNPSSNTGSSSSNSQSSALQPTIDKCTYQRYTGQNQSPECLNR